MCVFGGSMFVLVNGSPIEVVTIQRVLSKGIHWCHFFSFGGRKFQWIDVECDGGEPLYRF